MRAVRGQFPFNLPILMKLFYSFVDLNNRF